jgi:hypothetical protein
LINTWSTDNKSNKYQHSNIILNKGYNVGETPLLLHKIIYEIRYTLSMSYPHAKIIIRIFSLNQMMKNINLLLLIAYFDEENVIQKSRKMQYTDSMHLKYNWELINFVIRFVVSY